MKTIKLKNVKTFPANYTGIIEWDSGTKIWYKNGKFHRTNGPAIEWDNGSVGYFINRHLTSKEAAELFGWLFPEDE